MAADDAQSLGEVARGVHRIEEGLRDLRAELRSTAETMVTAQVFEARLQTEQEARSALADRVTANEVALRAAEDERDRVRLAITVAILTALVAPIVVALLLKGV